MKKARDEKARKNSFEVFGLRLVDCRLIEVIESNLGGRKFKRKVSKDQSAIGNWQSAML
jgi:hypothetical protein